jgi:hypothetical protein
LTREFLKEHCRRVFAKRYNNPRIREADKMANDDAAPKPPRVRNCATMEVYFHLLERHPQFRLRLGNLENATRARLTTPFAFRRAGPVTIDVVVHVVYRTDAENISNAQVESQIAVLNRDYSATNPDKARTPSIWAGLASNSNIEFALATVDPDGNATDGITRTQTAQASFASVGDPVKHAASGGKDAWRTDKYLNIWACSLGDSLLGYAQFPGGPADTDGVVILNTAFGTVGSAAAPFNLGRTATHEIGHWLNLRHIWGDTENCSGTDFVDDTPNAMLPNFGKPAFPHVSCGNGPNGDMFMNYMDYVDDDSMVMFTAGQVARMHATLDTERAALATP